MGKSPPLERSSGHLTIYSIDALSRVRLVDRLSTSEAEDVENLVSEMRARIRRERISLKPSFKVGRRTHTRPPTAVSTGTMARDSLAFRFFCSQICILDGTWFNEQSNSVTRDALRPLLFEPFPRALIPVTSSWWLPNSFVECCLLLGCFHSMPGCASFLHDVTRCPISVDRRQFTRWGMKSTTISDIPESVVDV